MTTPFLSVNEEPISLSQSLQYLQTAGKLQPMITEILRQYIIDREIKSRSDLEASPAAIEQSIINFRLERNLSDPQAFQQWLESNRMTYESFHAQISDSFKVAKFRVSVVGPNLEAYFQERKPFLDAVVLSRISVEDYELAETLYARIKEQETRFEELAREYSITSEKAFNGMMGAVNWANIPDNLKLTLQQSVAGQIIGPIEVEGGWCIFRVEQFLETSLENPQIRQKLENELFERWLNEQLKSLKITLQVPN